MKPKTETITVRLERTLKMQVEKAAAERGLSLTVFMDRALRIAVNQGGAICSCGHYLKHHDREGECYFDRCGCGLFLQVGWE